MITEQQYVKTVSLEHRKKFAQFFTPMPIADFMASWVLNGNNNDAVILEPAFGLGIFTRYLYKSNPNVKIVGYDIDKTIYSHAREIFSNHIYNISLINQDYLTSSWTDKYDGIICNPPYLKFHDYDNTTLIPHINSHLNIHLNGFTNIYTLFLLKSLFQLKEGGRLAYIVPSEFLNSDYGVEVKRALLQSGTLRHIIIVDYTKCAFDDALTTACILLCHKSNRSDEIHFSNIVDINGINTSLSDYVSFSPCELNPEVKWKRYYEHTHSSTYKHLVPLSTFAKVTRGIATGANNYFTFNASKIDSFNLSQQCFLPCICHATDVQNQIFTMDDFDYLYKSNKTVFLFNGKANETDIHVKTYLNLGIQTGINTKYLTSSRSPWYAIENRPPAPIWVTVFNRKGLRFVRNKAGVYNLTTFHCIYNNNIIETDILFAYLVTDLAKEIFLENSRQYGNGLVKFEPNDLNNGSIVDLRLLNDKEKLFVLKTCAKLKDYQNAYTQIIALLDTFFKAKYTSALYDLEIFENQLKLILDHYNTNPIIKVTPIRVKQLNLYSLFEIYGESSIVDNNMVSENFYDTYSTVSRNVLISLVKTENQTLFDNKSAKIYYTGRKFPSTIELDKLYYFIPYIKHKGIRDLYLINTVRIGTRKEGQPDNDPSDLRLVFEIKFIQQLFVDYKPIKLKIWRTYTDTTIKTINQLE